MEKELAEIMRNITPEARCTLREKFAALEVATLGDDMQQARINEIYDATLRENEFYAEHGSARFGVEPGGRVLSHEADFLLSEADFSRLLVLAGVKLAEAGICDKDGYYLTNWTLAKIDARNALIDFIISVIVPESFRPLFRQNRFNYTKMQKLIEITKPLAA